VLDCITNQTQRLNQNVISQPCSETVAVVTQTVAVVTQTVAVVTQTVAVVTQTVAVVTQKKHCSGKMQGVLNLKSGITCRSNSDSA